MSDIAAQQAEHEALLQQVSTALLQGLPITGLAIVLSKVDEIDLPLVYAANHAGPLSSSDPDTLRALLIATTRFQAHLSIMLENYLRTQIGESQKQLAVNKQVLTDLVQQISAQRQELGNVSAGRSAIRNADPAPKSEAAGRA